MKIIVFGATGTVGAYTSVILKEKGYEVVAVGRRKSDNGFFNDYGIPYYSVDITKIVDFQHLANESGIDAIVHLAGVMPAQMEGYDPQQYIDSVITGTLNVLDFAVQKGAQKIVFVTSRADSNYLMGKEPIPSDIVKKFPLNSDHSVYSICKNAAVDLIEHYYHKYGLKRYVLRFTTVYAYHPNKFFFVNGIKKPMAYRYIMDQAMAGNDIEVWGDPTKGKEIVYVEDAVQLIEKSLLAECDGGVYNLGRGIPVTLDEQIKGIIEVFSKPGHESKLVYRPDKPDAREYVNDISKPMKELGYKPKFDYIEGLKALKHEMEIQRFAKLWGKEE
ncbi:MAG: NAD(P)-dependent oxidoreductase [Bacteroidaceae bacterium]|nr:NAD(P)-dependent oxidoreductase [Bacteroidaceae bacterium]